MNVGKDLDLKHLNDKACTREAWKQHGGEMTHRVVTEVAPLKKPEGRVARLLLFWMMLIKRRRKRAK